MMNELKCDLVFPDASLRMGALPHRLKRRLKIAPRLRFHYIYGADEPQNFLLLQLQS